MGRVPMSPIYGAKDHKVAGRSNPGMAHAARPAYGAELLFTPARAYARFCAAFARKADTRQSLNNACIAPSDTA